MVSFAGQKVAIQKMKPIETLLRIAAMLMLANCASAQNWTQTSAPNNGGWDGVASSADGTKLVSVIWPGSIYTSTNSGATWTNTSAPNKNWGAVASSADGTKLAAATSGGGIY